MSSSSQQQSEQKWLRRCYSAHIWDSAIAKQRIDVVVDVVDDEKQPAGDKAGRSGKEGGSVFAPHQQQHSRRSFNQATTPATSQAKK